MPCALCEPSGRILYEDDDARVLLHDDWAVRGHVMIVARRHVENVSDLPSEEWTRIAALWHRVERVLLVTTKAERAIVMKLGIQSPHLHLHLYPASATATREEVFAAIDGRTREREDEGLVEELMAALRA